ncbi:PREDICTED: protein PLANT CADMIUM RESISTANCE 4-like [Nelumbo nucifera]|uniref:Protein PLANT CADMIUM RESISTANCE 4-like n=2 Tax=Nelumbo nucifera TaxID=4432 RepID=A0A1U8ACK1_NELNU|nr:PREDICTED: protein PLANT CADMIUM RESISTANCE 4-like [Nelumbo nucifera]DAD31736.1 TPA_asm: hypothetical protein HUJ06_010587 [Nelumbo nucifera]
MGRVQSETHLPYPPLQIQPQAPPPQFQSQGSALPLQPQPQIYSYPPPQQPIHQSYPPAEQPLHIAPPPYHNHNFQQGGNFPAAPPAPQSASLLPASSNAVAAFPQPVQSSSVGSPLNRVAPGPQTSYQNAAPGMQTLLHYTTRPARRANSANIGTTPWTTELFDCMQDPTNALTTAFFPCITFGQIAEILDNGHTTCATSGIIYAFSPCILSRGYRRKLRQRFGLVEAPASDWLIHSLFEQCALCQEYRELKNRGIDPSLGLQGNMAKSQSQKNELAAMVPPQNQTMK